MVLALLGGAGYLAYNIYSPPSKKPKRQAVSASTNEPAAPVDPDEWIPVHHRKSKKGSAAAGATSGEESEAAEVSANETSGSGKPRSRKGRK